MLSEGLALGFVGMLGWFEQHIYLALILTFVGLVQVFPLASRFTDTFVCCCLPVIGARANVHGVGLTYNTFGQ